MSTSTDQTSHTERFQFPYSASIPLSLENLNYLRSILIQKTPNEAITSLREHESTDLFTALLSTAEIPSLSHPHRALTCDTISAWLIRSKLIPALRLPLSDSGGLEVWTRLCQIILSYLEDASAAVAKSLKDLLTNVLGTIGVGSKLGGEVLRWIASRSMEGIENKEGKKGGYYCLDVSLRKGLSANWVLEQYRICRATEATRRRPGEPLLRDMLRSLEDRNLCPAIGKAFTSLVTSLYKELAGSGSNWMSSWESPIMDALADEDSRGTAQIYILPGIFKASPTSFHALITNIGMTNETSSAKPLITDDGLGALLCCLKVGKDLDLVGDTGGEELDLPKSKNSRLTIESSFIAPLLAHIQSHVRIAALNLVAYSPANTRPFTSSSFQLLKDSLPALHNETDPEVRDVVIGIIRNIVERLASSSYVCEKELKTRQRQIQEAESPPPHLVARAEKLKNCIDNTKEFCIWYINFLETLLRPGRNYQRSLTGLRALSVMVKSGVDASLADYAMRHTRGRGSALNTGKIIKKGQYTWPDFAQQVRIFQPSLKETLVQALFNPYDDIRDLSADILSYDSNWTADYIQKTVERGLHTMNTSGRARDSDGLARTLALVFEVVSRGDLEINSIWGRTVPNSGKDFGVLYWILDVLETEYLQTVSNDLGRAVRERPIHGIFSALNYILQKPNIYNSYTVAGWKDIHHRIYESSHKIWRLVEDSLCTASPEGHVPEEFDDEEDEDSSSQTAMSYAWRAIKESSALLGSIVKLAPHDPASPENSVLSESDFDATGKLLLAQLSYIRHRGAFSAVSPSFVGLCARCFGSPDPALRRLPKTYLDQNLSLILEKSSVITRRSGGLPYLIVGILVAETDRSAPLLASTFNHLLKIANVPAPPKKDGEKLDLPQVHASNCLRQMFTDSRLTGAVTPYIGPALSLAVSCFGSEIWAIRNCGVMLFTTLTNRLFGTKRSRNDYTFTAASFTTKSFFEKYPSAREVLLQNLKDKVPDLEQNAVAVEMVYPALSLLARMDADPEYDIEEFRPLVTTCMRSRIWKVREMSARAFTALVKPKEVVEVIGKLVETEEGGQNGLHGRLCAVRALMERRVLQAVTESGDGVWALIFTHFSKNFSRLMLQNHNSLTKSLFLQIIIPHLSTILESNPSHQLANNLNNLTPTVAEFLDIINASSTPGLSQLMEHLATLTITLHPDLSPDLLSTSSDELTLYTTQNLANCPNPVFSTVLTTLPTEEIWATALSHSWLLLRSESLRLLARFPADPSRYQSLLQLVTKPTTDPIREHALVLLGSHTTSSPITISSTIHEIRVAAHEDNPFTLRSAGLEALSHLLHLPREEAGGIMVKVYETLFDYLHDDDSDLRARACQLTRMLLNARYTLLPTAAGASLLEHMVRWFGTAKELRAIALKRIIGCDELSKDADSARELARAQWKGLQVQVGEGQLFAREKGNLFVDATDVVEAFGGVLKSIVTTGGDEEMQILNAWADEAGKLVAVGEVGEEVLGYGTGEGEEEVWEFLQRVRVAREVMAAAGH